MSEFDQRDDSYHRPSDEDSSDGQRNIFSNVISKLQVKTLAEADENEVVREVHEYFMDGSPIQKDVYALNTRHVYNSSFDLTATSFDRIKQSIVALLLQLKKSPIIRYQNTSLLCQRLSDEVSQVVRRENVLFETAQANTLLVIMDRSLDPVTPLLNQWTYEAMIHELIGMTNNRVMVEKQNMVLSELYDDFFTENIISNFGEIGQNIKMLLNEYQEKTKTHKNLESIADMKNFVDDYQHYKKISSSVSKHVTIVGELSKIVQNNNLLEISELEQTIVVDGDHNRCLERIKALINDRKTTNLNALRLVLLYALRFEKHPGNELSSLVNAVNFKEPRANTIVGNLLRFAGSSRKSTDLFGGGSTMEITKKFIKGLSGVENVYTQHEPYVKRLVENIIRGRNLENFPSTGTADVQRIENVIIFIVGGATFEEAAYVRSMNLKRSQGMGGPALLLASNCMQNTTSFIEDLKSF